MKISVEEKELINNDVMQTEDEITKEQIKIIGEKFVICAGAILLAHGILCRDINSYYAAIALETPAITLLQCSKLNLEQLQTHHQLIKRKVK